MRFITNHNFECRHWKGGKSATESKFYLRSLSETLKAQQTSK